MLDVLHPLYHVYVLYMKDIRIVQEYGHMHQEKFGKKMELRVLGYRSSGAWSSSLYKYITAATVQGHDPSTASHPGTLPVLFNGAKHCCWAMNPGLCSAFSPCTTRLPQSQLLTLVTMP